ncbi:hypothetical protein GH714_006324 [Hevea brasiliensis]|uniref:B3 domain-containing protein n=1 Tax=Hevea brasiliensis TaxID=3981 RepID=A0A6A6KGX6_HEVBR|nr:hypothetical protein GH714_001194 [Hevea brasiliensis]KAF2287538.1 hypothetical protein GH714_001206 [Hevea brasiliensis]KAF2324039.1 hypothetical protein GH714_006324 [Hevea brasiliensis]
MGRVVDADDGGFFDRMVAAIKLVDESILTAFMQKVRAEAIIKHDDRLAAYVPKKSRGHRQRLDIKPHSHSSLFLHVKSSRSMNENKKRTPTDMPEEWWHKIQAKGGIDVKLVIMKQMFASDLSTHHDCFSIPFKQIRDFSFLTEDEKRKLKEPKEKMPVTLMEPCGSESKMWLRQWNLKSSSTYVLTSSWKKVIERNHKGSSNKTTWCSCGLLGTMEISSWHCLRLRSCSGNKGENGDGAQVIVICWTWNYNHNLLV